MISNQMEIYILGEKLLFDVSLFLPSVMFYLGNPWVHAFLGNVPIVLSWVHVYFASCN